MKGPGLRLNGDVRRVWRCPACGNELPTGGSVTSQRCGCEKPPRFMQLVEPRRNARPEAPPLDVYFEYDGNDETESPLLADAPVTSEEHLAVAVPDDFVPDSEPDQEPVDDLEFEPGTAGDDDVAAIEAPVTDSPDEEDSAAAVAAVPGPVDAAESSPAEPATVTQPDTSHKKRKRNPRRGRRRRGRGRRRDGGPQSGSGGADSP